MTNIEQQRAQKNRGTIFVEEGVLQKIDAFPGEQYVMRIQAPQCARDALPGSFAHLQCATTLPMRRPLSIMRVVDDCIDILFKIHGAGLRQLADKKPGDTINVLGPIGQTFRPSIERPNTLLIGGGVGIPPMVFLADYLQKQNAHWRPLAILGSELPFPFEARRSAITTPWLDANTNATMPLLEDWEIPCRLATLAGYEGCFDGYVTQLADKWLSSLDENELAKTELFSCGPTPMLQAVAELAARYDLPCQVSLEEFMACAVGGCAGCAVRIRTADGDAMKRVCVDGPVFEASTIVW